MHESIHLFEIQEYSKIRNIIAAQREHGRAHSRTLQRKLEERPSMSRKSHVFKPREHQFLGDKVLEGVNRNHHKSSAAIATHSYLYLWVEIRQ